MNAHTPGSKIRMIGAIIAAAAMMLSAIAMTDVSALSRVPAALSSWRPFATATATVTSVAPARRVAETIAAPAAYSGSSPTLVDTPTSVTFEILQTACDGFGSAYGSTQVTFKIGATTVGTLDPRGDCTCNPGAPKSVTTSDPAVMALFDSCPVVNMTWNSQLLIGWARVLVNRPSGVQTLKILDKTGSYSDNVCFDWETAVTYSSELPDDDADGINNCIDPDLDNDGIANGADNCPSVSNPGQADSDADGVGNACQAAVVAVPWLGAENVPHQVYSGGTMTLQAAAMSVPASGIPLSLLSATWDPGDGSGPQAISVTNPLGLELNKVYTGPVGQPFTATISVKDTNNVTYTDTFKVVIAPNNRDTQANMAIDKGLWNLHKRINKTMSDGLASGYWVGYGGYNAAATAGTVQAFEINNHHEGADPSKDPYVDDVHRGLRYILSGEGGQLAQFVPTSQNGNNPDANANGFALYVNSDHASYIGGQVMDALVASGTPDKTAETGLATYVKGRTYKDIMQDMLDGYSWGMADNTGGWHYTYQGTGGNNDTSASHWWAIGVLASEVWHLDAPQWVKDIQWNIGVPLMQAAPPGNAQGCYFGYTNSAGNWWGDNQTNVTAAGLILMNADDIDQNNPRFKCAEKWLDSNWSASVGNFYTMYQTAKAMRTAINPSHVTTPITMLNGTRDWYADFADYLIANQNTYGDGGFYSVASSIGSYIQADMATSWGVIILSPGLFEIPPVAACTATPNELGTTGGLVNFSAAGSNHPDPNSTIVSYAWNFDDASAAGSGVTTSHTYTSPGSYPTTRNAKVTVTDDKGRSNTATCAVTIVDTNVKPTAITGGPYSVCLGTPLTLNGSASFDSDGTIASYQWSWGSPMTPQATGAVVDASGAFGVGTHDLGLTVTDNLGKPDSAFTTVTVLPITDPSCNQPPDAVNDSATTFSGTPVTVSVLANDTDTDVPAQTLVVTATTQGANGSVSTDGVTATYTPALGFFGTDAFTYTISDGHGGTDTATVTITIDRRAATVTAGSGTKVYGSGDPSMPPSSTGFLAADGITLSQTRVAGEDVGNYATTATAAGATLANYAVTYTAGNLQITPAAVTATAGSGGNVYDGSTHSASACVVSGAYTGDLSCTNSPAISGPNVGSTTISPVLSGSVGNFTIVPVDGSYTITPASVTATAGSGTAVYDGATHAPSACVVTGAYTGDLSCVNAPVVAGPGIGSTTTSPVVSGSLGNFTITPVTGSFTITAAPTSATVTAPTITYAANGAVTVTVTSSGGTVVGSVSLSVDGGAPTTQALVGGSTIFAQASPNAGDHALVATYAAQGNFQATSASGNLHVNKSPTATTLTSSPSPQAAGQTVTLTATVVATAPGSGTPVGNVSFYDGAALIASINVNGSGVAILTTAALSNGPHTITAQFNEAANYLASNAGAVSQLIYGYPTGGGTFVIGNNNALLGNAINFWGSQWEKNNSMTGGASNASFKGFATGPTPPTVGATFTSAPGNSAPPPASVPEYIGIIVTSKVTKSGSNITGTIVKLVVVKVNPGYAGDPGHAGTGTIVAILP